MTTRGLAADVGQLLWVGFHGTEAPDELRRAIAAGDVGAVVLFRRNLAIDGDTVDTGRLAALNAALHGAVADGAPALLVAVDQEGGRVQRVKTPATVWPPMLSFDRAGGDRAPELARAVGRAMGAELAALGFDVDFAPVLDVHTNPANPIIGDRAFATDADRVADRALAFADGLHQAGVLSCGKHFPGHGDTHEDSHLSLPRVDHDMDRLSAVELAPFRRAAAAGLPMLMTAHVVFAALDDVPATLSPAVVGDLLRRTLGYRGVVVSDDLDMKAIAAHYGVADAAVRAVRAGCDALLLCADVDAQRGAGEALIRAAESSSEVRARVGESAARVRSLKARHSARRTPPGDRSSTLGSPAHQALARELRGD